MALDIREDDLTGAGIRALIGAHLDHMRRVTPPESVYALDVDRLKVPGVTFWSAWDGDTLVGCAALREIDPAHGEIKSMHTAAARRGHGIARRLLAFLITEARRRGYRRLSLETGRTEAFEPAQRLYAGAGFTATGPIPGYGPDPHSYFMTLKLGRGGHASR